MSKKLKIILIGLVAIGLFGLGAFYYVMNGGERDLTSEDTAFNVTSSAVYNEFVLNTVDANKKYLEKPIAISGTITSIDNNLIILDDKIVCELKAGDNTVFENQKIIVKGRVVGFDDLMEELKLDQCFILKN